jgi:hypothetical protein
MGMGGGGSGEARRAREDTERRERERQANISQGKREIDGAFNQFGDDYYDDYQDQVLSYYNPQIDDQYGDAQAKLNAALAGRGILESTVGAGANSGLLKEYNKERTSIANEAVDATNKVREGVENSKTDLYALNSAAADPEGMGARAVGSATALVAPPTLTPLGQVFQGFLQPWLNYQQGANSRPGPAYQSPIRGNNPKAGYGSGSVVR